MQDSIYIKRCIQLATLAGKNTRSNPKVGAVIVSDGKIIGEGYHRKFGGPHAEVAALENVKEADKHFIPGSTIYVSLEPCTHYGKTPPCTDRIISENIKRVVICTEDSNLVVKGQGVKKMREHGIEVVVGVEAELGNQLIEPFIANLSKLPYVILKIVQSSDGFIGSENEKIWLSNKFSSTISHKWRSEIDGIMIGSRTALLDDPELTTRLWPGQNPVRIVWDRNLTIPLSNKLFNSEAKTYVLNELKEGEETENLTLINIAEYSLKDILEMLFVKGINTLLVEGGSATIEHFYSSGLWNEARIITTKMSLQKQGLGHLIKAVEVVGECIQETFLDGDRLRVVKKKV